MQNATKKEEENVLHNSTLLSVWYLSLNQVKDFASNVHSFTGNSDVYVSEAVDVDHQWVKKSCLLSQDQIIILIIISVVKWFISMVSPAPVVVTTLLSTHTWNKKLSYKQFNLKIFMYLCTESKN